jgi:hypothetical protein
MPVSHQQINSNMEMKTAAAVNAAAGAGAAPGVVAGVAAMEELSLSELKAQLTSLGISTSTPGLIGDARYSELWKRLNNAKGGLLAGPAGAGSDNEYIGTSQVMRTYVDLKSGGGEGTASKGHALLNLSISDIKARLEALGEVGSLFITEYPMY